MIYDIQKASMMKRASAWLLDIILFMVVVTGCMYGWAYVFDPTPHIEELSGIMESYEQQFGGNLEMTDEEFAKLTAEEQEEARQISQKINEALNKDARALKLLEMIATYIFAMISLSILCAHFLLEFLIPLFLKNGQTLGKKCFGIALMRKDGVRVTPFMMFARTILGKSTVETMLPAMLFVLAMLGAGGLTMYLSVGLLIAQVIVPVWTANKTAIHDLIACTVAVDMSSQMIFDSPEEREAYVARVDEEYSQARTENGNEAPVEE
jgi:uncharacterized RDD family membrane protein YckC